MTGIDRIFRKFYLILKSFSLVLFGLQVQVFSNFLVLASGILSIL